MEYLVENKQNQKSIERFVLIFYSLYSIYLCLDCVRREWNAGIPFFIFVMAAAAWILHIIQWKTYRTRALWIVFIMQSAVGLYACNAQDLPVIILMLAAMSVLTAFFEERGAVGIVAVSTVMIFTYHILVRETFSLLSVLKSESLLFQVGNLACVEYIVYIWVKRRSAITNYMSLIIEDLQEAEQSQDDFLANISHEIRTPINTICGMSEIALRENSLDKVREELVGIQDAGHNLTALVNDILDFSQLQSGMMELEEENYNIASTINDIIGMTMAKKLEKNLELILDCDAGIPRMLCGDEKKIRRVIMNLVDNAMKFTSEGFVGIHIACRQESYGVNLMVTVTDTGIGIREENIEKLFISFSQMDTRRNRQEGGVGLGLAISKALVKQMGGNIAVESTYGKGSSFRFVVPQKVVDKQPIAKVDNAKKVRVATYINMEQFSFDKIRDAYSANIRHMVEQLQVRCNVCRSLAELKRRDSHEKFTHIFISLAEYREEPAFFDALAERAKVVMVIDRPDEKKITNAKFLRLYKPFFILPVVSILNGNAGSADGRRVVQSVRFTAPGAHVLVVDDNQMNIRVIEGLLKEYKIKVSKALSGMEALEAVESKDYDFVFMDHMMPEMDGIETFHRIRDKVGTYYKKIPIVALTANVAPGMRETFLEEGFADYISKPVEVSVLERVLKRVLPEEKIQYQEKAANIEDGGEEMADGRQTSGKAGAQAPQETGVDMGLDMETGMRYCGGEASYFEILSICCRDFATNVRELRTFLEERDWKNYTVKIHALKSNMNSIGAPALGNLAKELEMAGKREDEEYILARHEGVMEHYRQLIERIKKHPRVDFTEETAEPERTGPEAQALPEIADGTFDETLASMEEAMFEQDGKEMMRLLGTLQGYQYHDVPLAAKTDAVRRKIEMEDYMSAVDTLADIRRRLAGKGGR